MKQIIELNEEEIREAIGEKYPGKSVRIEIRKHVDIVYSGQFDEHVEKRVVIDGVFALVG